MGAKAYEGLDLQMAHDSLFRETKADTALAMDERRSTPRFDAGGWLVTVLGDNQLCSSAVVLNVSGGGCLLRLDFPMQVGQAVQLNSSTAKDLFLGEVVHCRTEGASYLAGIKFEHRIDTQRLSDILNRR
jgi:hypothetical protein